MPLKSITVSQINYSMFSEENFGCNLIIQILDHLKSSEILNQIMNSHTRSI